MKTPFRLLVTTLALATACWLSACSSTRKESAAPQGSTDILDLLTGFGESISKRDYNKAVGYLVPEERAQLTDGSGNVPEDKQKALASLRLGRLIRMPGVRVENGYLAGIVNLLPHEQSAVASEESTPAEETAATEETAQAASEDGEGATEMAASDALGAPKRDAELKQTVDKFFKAIAQKNWNVALNLINESERKVLTDDKGRLKDSGKSRLQKIDAEGKEALTLQDGKLTGVTLLLPSE